MHLTLHELNILVVAAFSCRLFSIIRYESGSIFLCTFHFADGPSSDPRIRPVNFPTAFFIWVTNVAPQRRHFNFRATKYLVEHGLTEFNNWFDSESWYPLGRVVGGTIYPGRPPQAPTPKHPQPLRTGFCAPQL